MQTKITTKIPTKIPTRIQSKIQTKIKSQQKSISQIAWKLFADLNRTEIASKKENYLPNLQNIFFWKFLQIILQKVSSIFQTYLDTIFALTLGTTFQIP